MLQLIFTSVDNHLSSANNVIFISQIFYYSGFICTLHFLTKSAVYVGFRAQIFQFNFLYFGNNDK